MEPRKTSASCLALAAFSAFLTAALSGCDRAGTDAGGDLGVSDSLDAESGRGQLTRYDFSQGGLYATGNVLDLAVQGSGFFILKSGSEYVYFRRPAAFFQDAEGYLILGNGKVRLQGIKLPAAADTASGNGPGGADADSLELSGLSDIRWPFRDLARPAATTHVKLSRNMDSQSPALGSILYTQAFLHRAESADRVRGLRDHAGNSLGIQSGDRLTFSAQSGSSPDVPCAIAFEIGTGTTVADLAAVITAFLRSPAVAAGLGTTVGLVTEEDNPLRGALRIRGNSAPIRNFQVTSNRPVSAPMVAKAFSMPAEIAAGAAEANMENLLAPAVAGDPLSALLDASGNGLGLSDGDAISFGGSLAGTAVSKAMPLTYASGAAGTTLQDILDGLRENFSLPQYDGGPGNLPSVAVDAAGSDDDIADGSIIIRGQAGSAFAIRDISVRATDADNLAASPNAFNTNMNATSLRDAVDAQVIELSATVFDGLGKEHTFTLRLVPLSVPGQWSWEAGLAGSETVSKGGQGELAFASDGSVASVLFGDGGAALEFDPHNGAAPVRLDLDFGGPGDFTGLTQFRSETTAAIISQDGFPAGTLTSIAIGGDGTISGAYSNGRSYPLFQIPLADFPNKLGLKQVGANSFLETPKSGAPLVSAGIDGTHSRLAPGAIECVSQAEIDRFCLAHPDCKEQGPLWKPALPL